MFLRQNWRAIAVVMLTTTKKNLDGEFILFYVQELSTEILADAIIILDTICTNFSLNNHKEIPKQYDLRELKTWTHLRF